MELEPQHQQPRRRRRIVATSVASVALVASGAVVAVRGLNSSDGNGSDGTGNGSSTTTSNAKVTKKDLEDHDELDGTLGYGDESEVAASAQGTITALPTLGAIINRGGTVAEVNGKPLTLWLGDRPLWRALDANADDGVDVKEVEANLVALGYAKASTLTVDNNWTAATTTALKKWQKAMGHEQTGSIAPGDVVMLKAPVRVAEEPTPVGGQASGPLLKVTSATREVTVKLDSTKQALVRKGMKVEVVLPSGATLTGKVTEIGTVATATDPQNPSNGSSIPVTVALDDPSKAGDLDSAPVTVRVVTSAAKGVLSVPVEALLALSEGGYAVEKVTGKTSKLVAVKTGAFADGWVEISGNGIAEGDSVKVPTS
jgi:hypothetical protein